MGYQALYRKYRPRVFEDVVGQEHITTTLKNEVKTSKIAHAYLFTGSRGTGKTTCSKILAKAVNCENLQDGDPCGKCAICQGIDDGSILDVVEIDAASNNGVDNIRDLREEAIFTPAQTRYRVYIIDEAHMLSTGAFNALLKIMEEPPSHVLFILATTEVHKIPATILSRCQRFDFKRISADAMIERLNLVAEREEIDLDRDGATLIARLADGGMRDALSLLDVCRSTCLQGEKLTAEVVREACGVVEDEELYALVKAAADKDLETAFSVLQNLHGKSVDFDHLASRLIGIYRDIMVVRTAQKPERFLVCTRQELDRLSELARRLKLFDIFFCMDTLQEAIGKMSRTPEKRSVLEMAFVKLCEPALDSSVPGLSERLQQLESRLESLGEGVIAVKQPKTDAAASAAVEETEKPVKKQEKKTAEKEKENAPAPSSMTPVTPLTCWEEAMKLIEKKNPALHGALNGSAAYTCGDLLLIDAPDKLFLDLIRQNEYSKASIKEAVMRLTGTRYRLGPYKKEEYVVQEKKDLFDEIAQSLSGSETEVEYLK